MTTKVSLKSHSTLPGGLRQRYEHLLAPAAVLPHIVIGDGELVPEPLEDALDRVTLLLRAVVIVIERAVNDAREWFLLG